LAVVATLTRWRACLSGVATAYAGMWFAAPHRLHVLTCALLSVQVFFLVAEANILNDIIDFDADREMKRPRPLVLGRMTVTAAWGWYSAACIAALAAAGAVGRYEALCTGGLIGLAALYSLRLKSTVLVGNVLVACCCGMPLLLGGMAVSRVDTALALLAGQVTLVVLASEVLKDARDAYGDALTGVRTIATAHGIAVTCMIGEIAVMVSVVPSFVLASRDEMLIPYAAACLLDVACVSFVGFCLFSWGKYNSRRRLRADLMIMRYGWTVALLNLILLRWR
jgi:4-hydroxybenzoate polyprenyltransferase